MKKLLVWLLLCVMAVSSALAESITVDGTVVSTETLPVVAPSDGVLYYVYWQEGDHVAAGSEAATLYSVTTVAPQAGTVKVFATEGEAVETLVERYGAVVYIEPDCQYTVAATTKSAFNEIESKILHPGETVYLRCTTGHNHSGVGTVTAVSGSSYTVEVSDGQFPNNETVYVYRTTSYEAKDRVGRGTVKHVSPVAVTGTGTGLVNGIHVEDGAHVAIGDALFDTVETTHAYGMFSSVDGTVAAVRVASGDAVTQGTVVAEIYPDSAMRLEIALSENDLRSVRVGDRVEIEFTSGETASGEIERISAVARVQEVAEDEENTDDDVYFSAYVCFDAADSAIRYGMTAKVTTAEDAAED